MHIMSILGNLLSKRKEITSSVRCVCFVLQNILLKHQSHRCIYNVITRMAAQCLFRLFQKVLRGMMHYFH